MCTEVALLFLLHYDNLSRMFLFLYGVIGFAFLLVERYFLKRSLVSCGLWRCSVLIIDAGKSQTERLLADAFNNDKVMGYSIVGVVEENDAYCSINRPYPCFGGFDRLRSAILQTKPDEIIIAAPDIRRDKLLEMLYQAQPLVNKISLVPDLCGMPLSNIEVDTFFKQKVVLLKITNNLASFWNKALKRAFDLAASIIGGILISPILFGVSLIIYVSDPGPILFGHTRIGENGKKFTCYKFRSMIVNAEQVLETYLSGDPAAKAEWDRDFKLKNDPRITRIGHFLRKSSLDELPQLINVIRGEMSLVGPRPIVEKEISRYGNYIQDFYMVSPGMTGFWQVSGRSDVTYDERVKMDSWYVRNWSLWLDVIMLIKTIGVVVGKKGVY